ncbi:MAG TPA: HD domain-containing protein [Phycisphaerae bacterium]
MPRRYVREFQAGERVEDQVFLISSKDLRQTSNGALYIHVVLADRTGQILGRVWQATEAMYGTMPEGGFLRIKGRTESYKGNLQLIVEAIRPVDAATVDLADFLPRTEHDVEAMWERVKNILREIKDPAIRALIKQFVLDEKLSECFKNAPAATQMHHAYIGGLLEHTLGLLELAKLVVPHYPKLSMDLMLAGLFLHDIGKTAELCFDTSFKYTDQGQLVGHVVQAAIWIDQKAELAAKELGQPFPHEIKWSLQHIVLSHHGTYEFGSPRLPATPEAIAIHHLDNLDAKLHMYFREIANDPDAASSWTQYQRSLETKIYKKDVMGIRK